MKGKKWIISDKIYFECTDCKVIIPIEKWKNNKHEKCNIEKAQRIKRIMGESYRKLSEVLK